MVVGVTPPTHSAEELAKLEEAEQVLHEWNGKEYTLYELTQVQRRLEREMKEKLRCLTAYSAAGYDEETEKIIEKLVEKLQKYLEVREIVDAANKDSEGEVKRVMPKYVSVDSPAGMGVLSAGNASSPISRTTQRILDVINERIDAKNAKIQLEAAMEARDAAFREAGLAPELDFGSSIMGRAANRVME